MHRDRGDGWQSWPGADLARCDHANLGALIAGRRRAAGLTQRELAGLAGVGLGTVRDVEHCRRPRSRSAARLAAVLGLDVARAGEWAQDAAGAMAAARGAGPSAGASGGLWLGVLGPLEAWRAGIRVDLGPPRQRAALGLLAVSPDELVRRESIIDALWDEDPPATAVNLVQAYVSRLRRVLDHGRPARDGDGLVVSAGASYRLRAGAVMLDLLAFGQIVDRARAARSAGDVGAACALYEDALGLWRGEPLADVDLLRGHLAVAGLAGRRAAVVLEYAEAASAAGWDERVLPRLEALAAAEPLNERAHARLMIALASAGRQDVALRVHEELRQRLDDQLGVRPGPELADAHLRVLRQEVPGAPRPGQPGPAASAGRVTPPSVVPRQLPGAVPHFVGRAGELETLTALLDQPDGAASTAVISAIGGTAGVGKTALAVQWAHQAADRFPDGQLYLNLRGYDANPPVTATDALAGFLYALGMPGKDIPPDEDQRAAAYRSLVCGRRMLVVLDNAREARQVRPLLPGSPSCALIVTSRDSLAGLVARDGARRLDLDLLRLADAVSLLRDLIGGRAAADPEATQELAVQCCRLPLALRVAAELATARPGIPLARLAAELTDRQRRLDLLDAGRDQGTAVRTVFSWSCDRLDPGTGRAFRLLGLHPAADFDRYALATLVGRTAEEADQILGTLVRAQLIQLAGPSRYGMHDLLRDYAREQVAARDGVAEQRAAMSRLLNYYSYTAGVAANVLYPAERNRRPVIPEPGTPVPVLSGEAAALAWLDAERASLLAVAARAARGGWPGSAIYLATILFRYLEFGGYHAEAAVIHGHAYRAARDTGDRSAEATALIHLGATDHMQSNHKRATRRYRKALALCHEVGDQHGQARALGNLGFIDMLQGRYQQATARLQEALDAGRDSGDQVITAQYLYSLGSIATQQGQHHKAAALVQQALAICRTIGDRVAEAEALTSLGVMYLRQGRYQQATDCHHQGLVLFQEVGYGKGQADALSGLGEIFLASGQPDRALTHFTSARSLAGQIDDEEMQARAAKGLGDAHHALNDPVQARRHWHEALRCYTHLRAPEAEQVRARLSSIPLA